MINGEFMCVHVFVYVVIIYTIRELKKRHLYLTLFTVPL